MTPHFQPSRAFAAAAIIAALFAGCTQPANPTSPAASTSQSSAPTPPPTPTPSGREPLGAADQIRVVAQAEGFLRALVGKADRDAWWAQVQPYLTTGAAAQMKTLQPSAVGFSHVNGSGELMPQTAEDRATGSRTVNVSTDTGRFSVQLTDPTGTRLVIGFAREGESLPTPAATNSGQATAADDTLKKFAADFMHAFVKPKPGTSTRAWWERIATMLTDDAIDTYADITPDAVAARRVTGPVKIEPLGDDVEESDEIRAVTVGTDAGTYRLIIQPPTGSSDRPLVIEIQEP